MCKIKVEDYLGPEEILGEYKRRKACWLGWFMAKRRWEIPGGGRERFSTVEVVVRLACLPKVKVINDLSSVT